MIILQNASFHYKNTDALGTVQKTRGIHDFTLHVRKGEFVVFSGDSGCGKTTLTRLINGLVPHYYEGELSGQVEVAGIDVKTAGISELSAHVGSVFQNPKSQFFNVDTTSELAFTSENMCVDPGKIRERISKVSAEMKLENLMGRSIFALSSGEKQKIACASVAVAEPGIMVLDEPSSNLDAAGIDDLKNILSNWKSKGKTIVIAEHRLYYLTELLDRLILLKDGKITEELSGETVRSMSDESAHALGLRAFHKVERQTRKDGFKNESSSVGDENLICRNLSFRYKNSGVELCFPELHFQRGAVTAIVGHNGTGKSTFARILCGLERKSRGDVFFDRRSWKRRERTSLCYMVMQDVNHQLFTESVWDEAMLSMPETVPAAEQEKRARDALEMLGLSALSQTHPMALSGGQKQRVAIASAVACGHPVLLFDEPTSGLDLFHMRQVADMLRMLRHEGKTILIVTHDTELIREVADDVIDFDQQVQRANKRKGAQ